MTREEQAIELCLLEAAGEIGMRADVLGCYVRMVVRHGEPLQEVCAQIRENRRAAMAQLLGRTLFQGRRFAPQFQPVARPERRIA